MPAFIVMLFLDFLRVVVMLTYPMVLAFGLYLLIFKRGSNGKSKACVKIAGVFAILCAVVNMTREYYHVVRPWNESLENLAAMCLGISFGLLLCLSIQGELR